MDLVIYKMPSPTKYCNDCNLELEECCDTFFDGYLRKRLKMEKKKIFDKEGRVIEKERLFN